MSSRTPSRLAIISHALYYRLCRHLLFQRRHKPDQVSRILIVHHLRLGDVFMLTPLLAKLRQQYPQADIVMTCPKAFCSLYNHRPYGVQALAFDPYDISTFFNLRKALDKYPAFDLAICPGDNRHSWLAAALKSRWIIAFSGDRPSYKSWLIDEQIPYPTQPAHWGEMTAGLVAGPEPEPYATQQWPTPDYADFSLPNKPYCILHVGASSSLKLWPAQRWQALAKQLSEQHYQVVWSGDANEQKLIDNIDPEQRYTSYAGKLKLPQLWHLFEQAALIVCPDTSVAHLGRIVNTPTIALFGPGNPVLHGAGSFWRSSPFIALSNTIDCRNQQVLFKRTLPWVQRCGRSAATCVSPVNSIPESSCMHLITYQQVWEAAQTLLRQAEADGN